MTRLITLAGLLAATLWLAACGRDDAEPAAPEAGAATTVVAPAAPEGSVRGVELPPYRDVTLPNGIRLLLMERRDVPLVAVHGAIRGGSLADPDGQAGTASLVASLLTKGAGDRDARAFAEAVDSVGGMLTVSAGRESLTLAGEFLSRDSDLMIELVADVLLRPALDADEFEKVRTRAIRSLEAARDSDPFQLLGPYGSAFLYGDHPYGRPVSGNETTLAAVTHESLAQWHGDQVGADRLILVIAGDMDVDAMQASVTEALGSWGPAAGELPEMAAVPRVGESRVLLVDKPDATQTYFWIGNVGVDRGYDARAALNLTNTVFGGRFTSMLNTALRVESGLTYGAGSRVDRYEAPGPVYMYSFTPTGTTIEAMDMALDVLDTLHAEGMSDETLQSARAYVLGQFAPELETSPQLAAALATLRLQGREDTDINLYASEVTAVGTDDIRGSIDAVYPERSGLVFAVIGKADDIRDDLARYGEVTEMAITEPAFRPGS